MEKAYSRLEKSLGKGQLLQLDLLELEAWILERFQQMNIELPDAEADFFKYGVDSMRAIHLRGLIVKNLDLGLNNCPTSIVHDCGNTRLLAKTLRDLRLGKDAQKSDDEEIATMNEIIRKYSAFQVKDYKEFGRELFTNNQVVILTGATGSLGSHILAQLVACSSVSKVYCFIRTKAFQSAHSRLASALSSHKLTFPLDKVTSLSSDISLLDFGLSSSDFENLRQQTTHIIHCAWAVNFTLSVSSFEPYFQSVHNLLSLALSQPSPAQFMFCSSTTTAVSTPGDATILSGTVDDLSYAAPIGYSRSKLIAEKITERAVNEFGANATILRIGQIAPARDIGSQLWNVDEGISLLIRTAVTLGVLPDKYGGDRCTWMQSDWLSKTILDIGYIGKTYQESKGEKRQLVYNILNPRSFSWKNDLLPSLKVAGLVFDTVSWEEWLDKLRAETDLEKNPSRKLLGFWERQGRGQGSWSVVFDTKDTEAVSKHLNKCPRVIDGDMIKKLVDAWKNVW